MFSFILLPRYESRWRYLIGSYDVEMQVTTTTTTTTTTTILEGECSLPLVSLYSSMADTSV
jgi:hypothetical protein